MSLPPVAPIPTANLRLNLAPEEWEACLDAWISLTDLYLRLPTKQFSAAAANSAGSLAEFLSSFYHETTHFEAGDHTLNTPSTSRLRKLSFMLVHRLYLDIDPPTRLVDFEFMADFCHAHARSTALSRLMDQLWKQREQELQKLMQKKKSAMLRAFDMPAERTGQSDLRQLASIMLACPPAAVLFMTGSDFLDALVSTYGKLKSPEGSRNIAVATCLGLQSLVMVDPPNVSLLSDHLYSLKTQADSVGISRSLLAELVTNTPLISRLRRAVSGASAERLLKLLDALETYRSSSVARARNSARKKTGKGKAKISHANSEMHVHRMSMVTQVQDLFPDLGSGFVLKLLDEYDDDVEQVTAHVLDDSLPAHLRNADRTEEAPVFDTTKDAKVEELAPRSTPPPHSFIPERHNVFDDDELDQLQVDSARLHIGKRKDQPHDGQPNKAAILSALAAFDSDDDERDDTYDVEDVGGTVDTAHPGGEPGTSAKVTLEENDMALFTAFKSSPELFGRTFNVRKGQARQALKAETGMTDEAIEGWAIMLQRDPKRQWRLEAQYGSFDGKQSELSRTSYRESPGGTETEDSDVPAGRGGFRGRDRGRGRGGRGGNAAGPPSDPNTAEAQRKKEANKGGRANHNRRDQHAKKMARGGFTG